MYRDTLLDRKNIIIFSIVFSINVVLNLLLATVFDGWVHSERVVIGILVVSLLSLLYIWFVNVRLDIGRFRKLLRRNKIKQKEFNDQTSLVYQKGFAYLTFAGTIVIVNIIFLIVAVVN